MCDNSLLTYLPTCLSCVDARTLLLGCVLAVTGLSAALTVWAASPELFASGSKRVSKCVERYHARYTTPTHLLYITASFVPLYAIFALFFGGLWSLM